MCDYCFPFKEASQQPLLHIPQIQSVEFFTSETCRYQLRAACNFCWHSSSSIVGWRLTCKLRTDCPSVQQPRVPRSLDPTSHVASPKIWEPRTSIALPRSAHQVRIPSRGARQTCSSRIVPVPCRPLAATRRLNTHASPCTDFSPCCSSLAFWKPHFLRLRYVLASTVQRLLHFSIHTCVKEPAK